MALSFKVQKYLLLIFVQMLCFLPRCGFKAPEAPSWETELKIPLIWKKYTMAELAEEERNLFVDSTGILAYQAIRNIPRSEIGDRLSWQEITKSKEMQIGYFNFPSPGSFVLSISLASIYKDAHTQNGQTLKVPPFNLIPVSRLYPEIPSFQKMKIKRGSMTISIKNELVITLGEPLTIIIKNAMSSTKIGEVIIKEKINPQSVISREVDISGKEISNQILVEISGVSMGTEGEPKFINENDSFSISITLSDLVVSSVSAKIPEIRFSENDTIAYNDSIVVQEATIKNGKFKFSLRNDFDVSIKINLSLPNIIKQDGTYYSDTIKMLPDQFYTYEVILDDYQFSTSSGKDEQVLKISWSVTLSSSNNIVTVRANDALSVEVNISKIVFSSLRGRLNRLPVTIGPIEKELNLPSVLDSVQLANAFLTLEVNHTFGFLLNTDLLLSTFDDQGNSASISLQRTLEPSPKRNQVQNEAIHLAHIAPLLNIVPTRIELKGKVYIGEKKLVSWINSTSYLEGGLKVSVPLMFSMASQKVESETKKVTIEEDNLEIIRDNILSGSVYIKIKNHLPIGASVYLMISEFADSVYTSPTIHFGPVVVDRGKIDPDSGKVIMPVESSSNLKLDENDLQVFEESPIFVGLSVNWPSSAGRFLSIFEDDYIDINAWCTVKVLVDNSD